MGILMGGLSPHPPIIIPEIGGSRTAEAQDTIKGLEELADEVKDKDADLLITISPHGPVFRDAIGVLDQEKPAGDFGDFGHPEIGFQVETNLDFIGTLKDNAAEVEINLATLSEFSGGYTRNVSTELDHGVLVPLYYFKKAGIELPLVALTIGMIDYDRLYQFGNIIDRTLSQMELDAVIITSGDLSHRLSPGAPAGYNPRGKEFDQKLVQLISEGDFTGVLNMDKGLIEKAGECGLRPLIIMLGALQKYNIKTEVKSYEGPFGVGYAVAGFYCE